MIRWYKNQADLTEPKDRGTVTKIKFLDKNDKFALLDDPSKIYKVIAKGPYEIIVSYAKGFKEKTDTIPYDSYGEKLVYKILEDQPVK